MEMRDSIQFTKPDFGANPKIFFEQVATELRKVTWPTRKQVIHLTIVVIAVSALVGLYLGGLDFIFSKIVELVLKK